jgi:hypothetical protein
MQRLLASLGVLGSGLWLALACSEDKTANFFPDLDAGSLGGLPGSGAKGGSSNLGGGAGGSAEASGGSSGGGAVAGAGGTEMPAGGDAGVNAPCTGDADCSDGNDCTVERCEDGSCASAGFTSSGTSCGSSTDDACTRPDTCDGAGVCEPNNNAGTEGTPCGSTTDDACTHPDTCDADGVCQPNNEPLGAPCGSQTADECSNADQCDENGQCTSNDVAAGTSCGDATESECTHHDVCGAGACLPNDTPNGSACTGGSCTQGQCVAEQPVGCPIDVVNSVPATVHWSSVGASNLYDGGCEAQGTPDYALVFTAPAAGTYRFLAHGLIDSTPYTGADSVNSPPTEPPDGDAVITVAKGSCTGPTGQPFDPLPCNDDIAQDNIDAQLDLDLTDQQVITVYLNERTQYGGGTGTLTITLVQ